MPVLSSLLACILSAAAAAGPLPPSSSPKDIPQPVMRRLEADGGSTKVWVFFADKGYASPQERSAALAALAKSYPQRATDRRRLRRAEAGLFDDRDLPLAAGYLQAVAGSEARIHAHSRWLNAVSLRADLPQLQRIAALPFVTEIRPVSRAAGARPLSLEALAPLRGPAPPPPYHGEAHQQLEQIAVTNLHALGFNGHGVVIAVLDTGFERTPAAFNSPEFPLQVLAEWDFINDDPNTANEPGDPPNQSAHGTYILGTLAAHFPGNLVGAAYRAQYILCKTEDVADEYPAEEDNYVAALEFAEFHGADIATSSLGYTDWYTQADFDGVTAVTTIAVNTAVANGLICFTSAGNGGHDQDPATSTLGAPADAFGVITCGAVRDTGHTASFSSSGPTADGRVKPEVLARGIATATVSLQDPTGVVYAHGTSLSTPLVAGAAACLLQARPAWTVGHMRTYLFTSASGYAANGTHDPLFVRGYGVINAAAARAQDCDASGVDDALEIAAGLLADCNGNGIPDVCEIAVGLALDLDGDGVPDDCQSPCPADWNADGAVNSSDISAFITSWLDSVNGNHLIADFNADGAVNSSDISAFITAWLTAVQHGC